MSKTMLWRLCSAISLAGLVCGCSLTDEDSCNDLADLKVTITASDSLCSSSEPVVLTVSVENRGDSRVVFGYGSSSCQLHSFARTGANDYFIPDFRICTRDVGEQALDPSESRTESWIWGGRVWIDGQIEPLPPGDYNVYGAAGSWISSASAMIEVRQRDPGTPDLPRLEPTTWLDLNGDGSVDFRFMYAVYETDDVPSSAMTNFLSVWPYGNNQVEHAAGIGTTPLADNHLIDGSLGWTGNQVWMTYVDWSIDAGWDASWSGRWSGVVEMSMALELATGGTSHYGWVKLSVDQHSGAMVVHDYAYQPVPGESILAGVHP